MTVCGRPADAARWAGDGSQKQSLEGLGIVGFLQAPGEHRHFLGGLFVAARLGHSDAVAIGLQRCGVLPVVGQRLAEQLPRRGVLRVARDRFAQVADGGIELADLEVFVAK
jgi:hypothetical protein